MEISSSEIQTVRSLWLPMDEALIMPVGDLQLDPKVRGQERAADFERFKKHIKWGIDHNAYFLGMGDYIDTMSPSNREKFTQGGFYDSFVDLADEGATALEEELMEVLEPTRGRWLGLLEGHHYFPHQDGTTTDTRLANFLGTAFLGTSSIVQVKFEKKGKHASPAFTIWAHHGQNGGKLLSTPLNQLEGMLKSFEADVYLVGHHHKKVAGKYPILKAEFGERGNHRLVHKNRILACTGSFLKGYVQGSTRGGRAQGNYPEKGMMNPVALGGVVLWARPKYDNDGYASVDLDVSL